MPSDPLWINAAAGVPEYNARELRRAFAAMLYPAQIDRFGAREGVRPGIGDAVTLSGTTWTVHDLNAVVYPGLTSVSGPYVVQLPEESGALDPADGSLDRIDAIDLQVQDDDEDSSGFRQAQPVYVAGTPASSPSAPPLTATSFRMATFFVSAAGTPAPTVTYIAPYTVASGGILPVRDDSEGPTAGEYHGQFRYRRDVDTLEVSDGSVWRPIARPDPPRIAAGQVGVTPSTATSPAHFTTQVFHGETTVFFPAGLFTAAPHVVASVQTGFASQGVIINTGCSGTTVDSTAIFVLSGSDTTRFVNWVAVQP